MKTPPTQPDGANALYEHLKSKVELLAEPMRYIYIGKELEHLILGMLKKGEDIECKEHRERIQKFRDLKSAHEEAVMKHYPHLA